MAYSNKVIDHYENPRNVGSFNKTDSGVGTGMVGAPACGDVTTTKTRGMWARSTKPTPVSAPAWSAPPPAAT